MNIAGIFVLKGLDGGVKNRKETTKAGAGFRIASI
jgi:hypothetical protein